MAAVQALMRALKHGNEHAIKQWLDDIVDDLTALKTVVDELKSDHNAAMTKLDADAGVTDVNYASLNAVSSAVGALKTTKA